MGLGTWGLDEEEVLSVPSEWVGSVCLRGDSAGVIVVTGAHRVVEFFFKQGLSHVCIAGFSLPVASAWGGA